MTVDVSRISELIPRVVALGRRSVAQQCVTSAAYIVKRAMDNTLKMEVDSIDARLETTVISYTNAKRNVISKAKNRTRYKRSVAVGKTVPLGVLVVMARMRPDSYYNNLTGGKWAIPSKILPTGPGSGARRKEIIGEILTRMISSRRSSVALLKSGWIKPLQVLNASPHMIRRGTRIASDVRMLMNSNKDLKSDRLGDASISETGNSILVTCVNLSTNGGNSMIQARHEHYAELQALPPLKEAITWEEANIARRIDELLAAGVKENFIDV